MLVQNPGEVVFGTARYTGVSRVVVDRVARRVLEEWSDAGMFAEFADIGEQMVRVRVVMDLTQGDVGTVALGTKAELRFMTGVQGADLGRRRVRTQAVLVGVAHELSARKVQRVLEFAAVSSGGVGGGGTDPLIIEDGGQTL